MELPIILLESSITRGTILHSEIFKNIDHGKFFVIIGINGDNIAGFFYINSRIHEAIKYKTEQFNMQYPIKAKDYSFLEHDSFINASSLITINRTTLANSMKNGETKHVGEIKNEDLELILEAVRESRLFSREEKNLYFY